MAEIRTGRQIKPTGAAVVILLVTLGAFGLIGPFIGMLLAIPFYEGDLFSFTSDLANPNGKEYMKLPLMIVQGSATLFGLIVIPTFIWSRMRQRSIFSLVTDKAVVPVWLLWAVAIVFFFFGPISMLSELNAGIDLPDGAFESALKEMESRAGDVTKFLTSFSSLGQFVIGAIVIAVLPGIGEELVFRGMLQPELEKMTGNKHAGVWLAAFFFSAIHLQFYGFIPRMVLGAIFGYLYLWSGNLWVPIVAHFFNNFFILLVMYLGWNNLPGMESGDVESFPWYIVVPTTMIFAWLMYRFHLVTKSE